MNIGFMAVYLCRAMCLPLQEQMFPLYSLISRQQQTKVILIDASKLGEEYKEGNNQKRRLLDNEIDLIVNTFRNKEAVEDFFRSCYLR